MRSGCTHSMMTYTAPIPMSPVHHAIASTRALSATPSQSGPVMLTHANSSGFSGFSLRRFAMLMPDTCDIERSPRLLKSTMCHANCWRSVGFHLRNACEKRRNFAETRQPDTKKPPGGGSLASGLKPDCPLVPKRGLEPLRLTSLPPQGSASTSSATWAGVFQCCLLVPAAAGISPAADTCFAAAGACARLVAAEAAGPAAGTSEFAGVASLAVPPAMIPRSPVFCCGIPLLCM
jgi:hypothetical protein